MSVVGLVGKICADQPWMGDALCAQTGGVGGDAWFPDKGQAAKAAIRVCVDCPVRKECLQYALDNNEHFGVWGGVGERARRAMRKDRPEPDRSRCINGHYYAVVGKRADGSCVGCRKERELRRKFRGAA